MAFKSRLGAKWGEVGFWPQLIVWLGLFGILATLAFRGLPPLVDWADIHAGAGGWAQAAGVVLAVLGSAGIAFWQNYDYHRSTKRGVLQAATALAMKALEACDRARFVVWSGAYALGERSPVVGLRVVYSAFGRLDTPALGDYELVSLALNIQHDFEDLMAAIDHMTDSETAGGERDRLLEDCKAFLRYVGLHHLRELPAGWNLDLESALSSSARREGVEGIFAR